MKHFHTTEQFDSYHTPHFGICPRCKEEQFLSVPTLEYGLICIYCLYELYPPNGLPRPLQAEGEPSQERTPETETEEHSSLASSTVVVE
jgi:hypothetical protein